MKKLLSLFLVPVLLFSIVPLAFSEQEEVTREEAEQIIHERYAEWSVQELAALFIQVKFELISRGYNTDTIGAEIFMDAQKEVTVPPGEYTVGEDIPSGEYTVLWASGWITSISVYDNKDDYFGDTHALSEGDSVGKLVLKKGNIVEIKSGNLVFKPYQGLGF